MEAATVDIIIAARDYGRFLGQAIASALAQTGVDVVVTVVDDGSIDDTREVVGEFDPTRVRYHRLERPRGTPAARNHGLEQTSHPYVAFLDADDVFPPDRTRVLLDRLRDSDAGYAHGVSRTFIDPGPPGTPPTTLIAGPAPGNVLFRRESFDRLGLFDEDVPYLSLSAWLVKARGAGLSGVSTDDVVVERRLHEANISRDDQKRWTALALVRRHRASQAQPPQ